MHTGTQVTAFRDFFRLISTEIWNPLSYIRKISAHRNHQVETSWRTDVFYIIYRCELCISSKNVCTGAFISDVASYCSSRPVFRTGHCSRAGVLTCSRTLDSISKQRLTDVKGEIMGVFVLFTNSMSKSNNVIYTFICPAVPNTGAQVGKSDMCMRPDTVRTSVRWSSLFAGYLPKTSLGNTN